MSIPPFRNLAVQGFTLAASNLITSTMADTGEKKNCRNTNLSQIELKTSAAFKTNELSSDPCTWSSSQTTEIRDELIPAHALPTPLIRSKQSQSIRPSKIREIAQRIKKRLNQPHLCFPDTSLQNALEVVQHFKNSESELFFPISLYYREPLTNLTKIPGLKDPDAKFAKFVSYERFVAALKKTFAKTLKEIEKHPPDKRQYILIVNKKEKSSIWVIAHLLGMMKNHPPIAIISIDKLGNFGKMRDLQGKYKDKFKFDHVIIIDDASYTGMQADEVIGLVNTSFSGKKIHVSTPFATKNAKKLITKKGAIFHNSQWILTYTELFDFGFLRQEKFKRPDIKYLMNIPLLDEDDLSFKQVNILMNSLKQTVFKQSDEQNLADVRHLIEEAELIKNRVHSTQKEKLEHFIQALFKVIEGVERWGENKNSTRTKVETDRALAWMAHKSTDNFSCPAEIMLTASGGELAIEPYKGEGKYVDGLFEQLDPLTDRNARRKQLIEDLQAKSPEIVSQWQSLTADIDLKQLTVVHSNRGFFLLSDRYIRQPSDSSMQVELILDGLTIPFGGTDGAYQLHLKEGMVFSIRTTSNEIYRFEFKNDTIKQTTSRVGF